MGKNKHFHEGIVRFTPPTHAEYHLAKKDGSYLFHYGYNAPHNGEVLGNTDYNVSLAMTRLTKTRLPHVRGFDQYMQYNQQDFIRENGDFLDLMREQYQDAFIGFSDMYTEAEEHYDDPHQKKELRVNSWSDVLSLGILFKDLWFTRYSKNLYTEYKMKIFEIAKPGKPARMIGDLGCPASLQGFRVTKYLKTAMADRPLYYNGGKIEFCPTPSSEKMEEVFRQLIRPDGKFYFVYFSDDSCLAVRTGEDVKRYNVDISSCDASHTKSLFYALERVTPECGKANIRTLIRQCESQITVKARYSKRERLRLKPLQPRLYSGCTLTTAINNLANVLIAKSIADECTKIGDNFGASDVSDAAERVGYIVTCEDCTADWHHLQFLKHSPVLDVDGDLRAVLNLGVLLRLSGTSKGDVPGSKRLSLRERCRIFQRQLLRGAVPYHDYELIRNMKSMVSGEAISKDEKNCERVSEKKVQQSLEYKVVEAARKKVYKISNYEMYKRYDGINVVDGQPVPFTPLLQAELTDVYGKLDYGEFFCGDATTIIMKADYGLSARHTWKDFKAPEHWTRAY